MKSCKEHDETILSLKHEREYAELAAVLFYFVPLLFERTS